MGRILVALLLFAGSATAAEVELDASQTTVNWTLGSTLHTVHGTFKLKRGTVRFDPATGQASGEIVIDTTSGESGGSARDHRMHKEVLESEKYPEAVFKPEQIQGPVNLDGDSTLDVRGQFRIHGAGHPLTLHMLTRIKGGQASATTSFDIPFVKWGMKNPGNFLLKVDDHVGVEVKMSGKVKP